MAIPSPPSATYCGCTYYGQVTRLLKKLKNAQEKATSGAPSASAPASTSTSAADSGFGFDFSLGSVLSPRVASHLASPAPYLAPISSQLGEAALPGNGGYPGGGDNQPPNDCCGQTAGAWGGSGGVSLTDATPCLVEPLPEILSNHAVSFVAAFKCGGGSGEDASQPR